MSLLDEAVERRISGLLVGQNQAAYYEYRDDPRFVAIRESIGLEP